MIYTPLGNFTFWRVYMKEPWLALLGVIIMIFSIYMVFGLNDAIYGFIGIFMLFSYLIFMIYKGDSKCLDKADMKK